MCVYCISACAKKTGFAGDWAAAHLEDIGASTFSLHKEARVHTSRIASPTSPLGALGIGGNAWSLENTQVVLAGETMLCLKHDTEDGR